MKCTKSNAQIILALLLLSMIVGGCYQAKDGCLDIYATNFDVTADNNCCCNYPVLQLEFTHKLGTRDYNSVDTITNDIGQSFKINAFSLYLSGIEFTGTSGNKFSTSDTIHLPGEKNTIVLAKDIALVRANTSNVNLGSLIQREDYLKVVFNVGVPEEADGVSFSKIPSSSNLSIQPDSLFDESLGYVSLKYVFSDGVSLDSKERSIRVFEKIPLSFDFLLAQKSAFNTCMILEIDHERLFHDVDVKIDGDHTIKSKIVANLQSAITLKSCE